MDVATLIGTLAMLASTTGNPFSILLALVSMVIGKDAVDDGSKLSGFFGMISGFVSIVAFAYFAGLI
ncbi:MAG: hypothetical protein R6U17_02980 [Thermoplasmata archaeon]